MNDIAVKKSSELTTSTDDRLMSIIERVALDPNADVNKLKEMLAMQEHIFDKNAEIEFNAAMTNCQMQMPSVLKESQNQQTHSKYAKLDLIIKVCSPVWTKNGFALSFGTDESKIEHHIGITCVASHSGGFSRNYRWDLPLDDVGLKGSANKTKIHASGSTVSYGRRYLTCMIFNIAVQDDDDGTAGNSFVYINDSQVADIESLIVEVKADRSKFLGHLKSTCGASDLFHLRAESFDYAIKALEIKRAKA